MKHRPQLFGYCINKGGQGEGADAVAGSGAHKNGKATESPLPDQGGGCGCRFNCKERTLGKKIYFCC
jgi:hypothetical protein